MIKKISLYLLLLVQWQSYGMLQEFVRRVTPRPKKTTQSLSDIQPYKHDGDYPIEGKIVWDPQKIYEAQEIGYMPVEVWIHSKNGKAKRTIYHGTHIKEVYLPDGCYIQNEDICKKTSNILHKNNIIHPIIIGSDNKTQSLSTSEAKNFIVFDSKTLHEMPTSFSWILGHELGHIYYYYSLNDTQKMYTDLYRSTHKKFTINLNEKENSTHSQNLFGLKNSLKKLAKPIQEEELICDLKAAQLLGSTLDEKINIIQSGIDFFKEAKIEYIKYGISEYSIEEHPSPDDRMRNLGQQKAYYLALKNKEKASA